MAQNDTNQLAHSGQARSGITLLGLSKKTRIKMNKVIFLILQ